MTGPPADTRHVPQQMAARRDRGRVQGVELVNLTPHPVRIITGPDVGDDDHVIPPSGTVARLSTSQLDANRLEVADGHAVMVGTVRYGDAESLPNVDARRVLIVSLPFALSVRRADLVIPFGEVRDPEGRIVGCRTLARVV